MSPLRILYRAEGSRRIGTGHVLRAVRLSHIWRGQDIGEVTLALSGDDVGADLAARASATVERVPGSAPHDGKPRFDPSGLASVASRDAYDVAVVDMLDTETGTVEAVRQYARTVVTLDDRGSGRREADAIINILVREPNPDALPETVELMEGPEYATLDAGYAAPAPPRLCADPPCKVLVTLGGADSSGLALKVAHAMEGVAGIGEVIFVCGVGAVHGRELFDMIGSASWAATVLPQVPSLRDLLIGADVAVVAGGLTMHEACCVGAPSLAVCQPIDHQSELAEWFHTRGAMDTVGDGVRASVHEIGAALARLIGDRQRRQDMASIGPSLVDGMGTERTARAIANVAVRRTGMEERP